MASPWNIFYPPFVDGDDDSNRYSVSTVVLTNSTGMRTIVTTYDTDCGSSNSSTTADPGFSDIPRGSLISDTKSETVETIVWANATQVETLSGAVNFQDQADKGNDYLESLRGTNSMKEPFGVTAYYDLGAGLTSMKCAVLFPSEFSDYATLVSGAALWSNRLLLIPDASAYPWNGHYNMAFADYGTDWYYASYGWGGRSDYTENLINNLTGSGSSPTGWHIETASRSNTIYLVASKSCHALTDGIGCSSGGVLDLVHGIISQNTEYVTSGDCAGLTLRPSFLCFGADGIFRPSGASPIAGSYSPVTTAGWFIADQYGNPGSSLGVAANGPIWWDVTCC